MPIPALSIHHFFAWQSAKIGPFIRTMAALGKDPAKKEAYMKEFTALTNEYFVDNIIRHEYVLSRAIKI
jgi:hypothetical protein